MARQSFEDIWYEPNNTDGTGINGGTQWSPTSDELSVYDVNKIVSNIKYLKKSISGGSVSLLYGGGKVSEHTFSNDRTISQYNHISIAAKYDGKWTTISMPRTLITSELDLYQGTPVELVLKMNDSSFSDINVIVRFNSRTNIDVLSLKEDGTSPTVWVSIYGII